MNWGDPSFVIAIIAVCTAGWLVNNWIRARHGYALEDEWGGKTHKPEHATAAALREENAALRQRLDAIEARAATLESIVTDKGYDVSRQIDALRVTRNEGVIP